MGWGKLLKNPLRPLCEVAYSVLASDWSGGRRGLQEARKREVDAKVILWVVQCVPDIRSEENSPYKWKYLISEHFYQVTINK